MKTKYVLPVFLLGTFLSFSQQFTITGKIHDKETNKPIEAATIFLKSIKDSSLVSYTISDNKGSFHIKGQTKENELDFFVTHIGNTPYKKRISIPKGTMLELGILQLEAKTEELEGVTVLSDAIPITVKKDTLEFNADAFKLRPDATVEELLKNLPGVEIDSQGNITVNGTPVNEILVNGKPFFDNPKIATKNLTKDIVKKIQVSDTKTKEQKFTKEEGDPNNKSINIVLKEDKNKGYFGRATVGYGNKEHYEINAFGNYFRDKTRVSVLNSSNNINTLGFEFDEVYGMMRNVGRFSITGNSISLDGMNFGGSEDGFNKSHVAGVSYVDEYSKDVEVDANYFYSYNDNETYSRNDRETTLPDRHYFSRNEQWGNSWGDTHNFRSELEYKIDSLTQISVRPKISISKNTSGNKSEEASYDSNKNPVNQSISRSNSQNHNLNFENRVSFNRRFKGKKGSWGISAGNNNNRSQREQELYNIRKIFGSLPSTQIRDQHQETNNRNDNYHIRSNIRYPLSKNFLLRVAYHFSKTESKSNINTYDTDGNGKYIDFNTALSSNFLTENTRHQPGLGFEWSSGKFRFSGDAGMVFNRLENQDFLRNLQLDKTFKNVDFRSWGSYEIKKGTTFDFFYNTNTYIPNVNQLQPIDNVNNPLHTFTGNPDLKPSFTNAFRINFNNYNWETRSGIFATLNIDFQKDKITSVTLTNNDLTRKTTYTNVDGDYSLQGGFNFNKSYKIEKNRIGYRLSFWGRINESNLYSNESRYSIANYSCSPSLRLEYNYDEKIDLNLGYSPSLNKAKYDLEIFDDRDYTTHRTSFKITSYIPKNVIFGSDIEFSYLPYMGEGFRKSYFYWNMSLGYKFGGEKATLQLKAFDLLNQTVDAWRTITQDYVQDSQKLMLKQYFMLSFSYKINKVGGKGEQSRGRNNFRIIR